VDRTYVGLATALGDRRRTRLGGGANRLNEGRKARRLLSCVRLSLLRRPRFAFGALCASPLRRWRKVAIGSLLTNYLMRPDTLRACRLRRPASRLSLYWGGAMVGRFIGAGSAAPFSTRQAYWPPQRACAITPAIGFRALHGGFASGFSLISIGLFNSIMFSDDLLARLGRAGRPARRRAPGLICMAD